MTGGAHERLQRAVAENVQREDMPALDTAASFAKLQAGGDSISDIVKLTGFTDSYVRNLIAVHGLPDEVKALMNPALPRREQLQLTAAIDITAIRSPEVQIELANEAVDRNLSVVETRFLIEQRSGRSSRSIIRSGHERSPSERFASLSKFIGRTDAWLTRFMQNGRDPIDDFYHSRDLEEDDRAVHAKKLDTMIYRLQQLRDIVAEKPKN